MTERERCEVIASSTGKFMIDEIDEIKWVEHYNSVILSAVPALMLEGNYKLDLVTIVKFLFAKALLYAGAYEGFNYYLDNEGYLRLIFRHKKGIKNSRIIGTAYSALLEKHLRIPN